MGKIDFTTEQKSVIKAFKQESFLARSFYFTGGTALSIFYLHHRLSDDLDFFSENAFDAKKIMALVQKWTKRLGFKIKVEQIEEVLIFNLVFRNRQKVKLDFCYYPYQRLKRSENINNLALDSLLDIAVNKLLSINQRTEVKDFVDLYFLKDKFTLWDLLAGVKKKFRFEINPILLAADLLKVEEFDFLPRMILPLELNKMQDYFKKRSREIAGKFIE